MASGKIKYRFVEDKLATNDNAIWWLSCNGSDDDWKRSLSHPLQQHTHILFPSSSTLYFSKHSAANKKHKMASTIEQILKRWSLVIVVGNFHFFYCD